MKYIIASILCIFILSGCSTVNVDEKLPVSKTVIQDNFELTITSSQSEYSLKRLLKSEPLDITATLTYVGSKEQIEVWRSFSFGIISLYHENGELEIAHSLPAIQIPDVINREEDIAISEDFIYKNHMEELIIGNYIAEAWVYFDLDIDGIQKVEMTVEIPFIISK